MPNLASLLAQPEGTTLEFKRSIDSPGRIAKTLAAFANTAGGTLVVGVNDDRTVRGIVSEKEEVQKLESASEFWVEPPLLLRYETVETDERKVLIFKIEESANKPHRAKNERGEWEVYVRTRDKSVPASKRMGDWLETAPEADPALLASPNVKALLQFLQKTETVTAGRTAKLLNVSEYRAQKLLHTLTRQGVLLFLEKQSPKRYALRKS